jgi:hypothetical protein
LFASLIDCSFGAWASGELVYLVLRILEEGSMNGGQSTIHGAEGVLSSSYSGEVFGLTLEDCPELMVSLALLSNHRDYDRNDISIISQLRSYENSRFTIICVAVSGKPFAGRKVSRSLKIGSVIGYSG